MSDDSREVRTFVWLADGDQTWEPIGYVAKRDDEWLGYITITGSPRGVGGLYPFGPEAAGAVRREAIKQLG